MSAMRFETLVAIAEHKKMLAKISASELQDRIRQFRRLDLKNIDDEQLYREIRKVLSFRNPDGSTHSNTRTYSRVLPAETKFFRARRIADLTIPPSAAKRIRDAEAPDGSFVKSQGRLNKIGEGLLYTAINDPSATFSECRIPTDGFAVIFCYTARRPLNASIFGAVDTDPAYSSEELLKINMINDFFYDEFTREVEKGLEHLYRPSEMIAKTYFDVPPQVQDCWTYPSTKNRSITNATFTPKKAHECLELMGVMVTENKGSAQVKVYFIGRPGRKNFEYFPVGSPEQRALFPEIA